MTMIHWGILVALAALLVLAVRLVLALRAELRAQRLESRIQKLPTSTLPYVAQSLERRHVKVLSHPGRPVSGEPGSVAHAILPKGGESAQAFAFRHAGEMLRRQREDDQE